eukprot:COSAG01_NODE_60381_length_295_cov_0.750000_1_plen_42_part_01
MAESGRIRCIRDQLNAFLDQGLLACTTLNSFDSVNKKRSKLK